MPWTDVRPAIGIDKPIRASTHLAMYENLLALAAGEPGAPPLDGAALINASVTANKLAPGIIDRAALKTAVGEVSTTSPGTVLTLPGGSYGFYPQLRVSGTIGSVFAAMGYGDIDVDDDDGDGSPQAFEQANANGLGTSNRSTIVLGSDRHLSSDPRIFARQRYVQSSPPYDLGDGEIPVFVFAQIEAGTGRVLSTYIAPDPPWAYNGPTETAPQLRTPDGRAWRFKPGCRRAACAALDRLVQGARRHATIDELAAHEEAFFDQVVPVDQALKNADLAIVPHPFCSAGDDCRIVLLDPPATLDLLDRHEDGDHLAAMLHDGDLILGNDPLPRATPPGVVAVGYGVR
jgi:hypothetical protein